VLQSQAGFSVIFAVVLLRERPGGRRVAGLVVAAAGIAVVASGVPGGPLTMLAPVFAILTGALLLGQPVHPTDVAGGAAVLAGIALGLSRPARARVPDPVPSALAGARVPARRS
jgi:drug/metabolite transporter (DMT)-like permease